MSLTLAAVAIRHPGFESVFTTLAEAAATLVGLLFVALSFDLARPSTTDQTVAVETRAGAALLCFLNVLVTSLVALTPGNEPGEAAVAFAVVGWLYLLASIGPLTDWMLGAEAEREERAQRSRTSRGLILVLGLAFTAELACGLLVALDRGSSGRLGNLVTVLMALLVIGIYRTWDIVGIRDPGVNASLRLLSRRLRRRRH